MSEGSVQAAARRSERGRANWALWLVVAALLVSEPVVEAAGAAESERDAAAVECCR